MILFPLPTDQKNALDLHSGRLRILGLACFIIFAAGAGSLLWITTARSAFQVEKYDISKHQTQRVKGIWGPNESVAWLWVDYQPGNGAVHGSLEWSFDLRPLTTLEVEFPAGRRSAEFRLDLGDNYGTFRINLTIGKHKSETRQFVREGKVEPKEGRQPEPVKTREPDKTRERKDTKVEPQPPILTVHMGPFPKEIKHPAGTRMQLSVVCHYDYTGAGQIKVSETWLLNNSALAYARKEHILTPPSGDFTVTLLLDGDLRDGVYAAAIERQDQLLAHQEVKVEVLPPTKGQFWWKAAGGRLVELVNNQPKAGDGEVGGELLPGRKECRSVSIASISPRAPDATISINPSEQGNWKNLGIYLPTKGSFTITVDWKCSR